jgi:hypothetical protein
MSAPTLTFTPAMFHASLTGIKNTTRRLITADCFRSQDGRLKFLGDANTVKNAAHASGQIKPMVTTWAVKAMFDDDKPTDLISSNDNPLKIWFNDGSLKPLWAGKNRPGRFLPAHLYARAPKVEILTVTAEFLHDITEDGARQEGISQITKDQGSDPLWKYGLADKDGLPGTDDFGWPWNQWQLTARDAYFKLWDTINAEKDGGKYAAKNNPACWVITFRVLPSA